MICVNLSVELTLFEIKTVSLSLLKNKDTLLYINMMVCLSNKYAIGIFFLYFRLWHGVCIFNMRMRFSEDGIQRENEIYNKEIIKKQI